MTILMRVSCTSFFTLTVLLDIYLCHANPFFFRVLHNLFNLLLRQSVLQVFRGYWVTYSSHPHLGPLFASWHRTWSASRVHSVTTHVHFIWFIPATCSVALRSWRVSDTVSERDAYKVVGFAGIVSLRWWTFTCLGEKDVWLTLSRIVVRTRTTSVNRKKRMQRCV